MYLISFVNYKLLSFFSRVVMVLTVFVFVYLNGEIAYKIYYHTQVKEVVAAGVKQGHSALKTIGTSQKSIQIVLPLYKPFPLFVDMLC